MNPFGRVNRLADRFEDRFLPSWLTYDRIGDPVSWIFSHPAFTLLLAGMGAVFAGRRGAVVGAFVMVGVYAVREVFDGIGHCREFGWASAIRRVQRNPYCTGIQCGWLVDGVCDVLGPLTVAVLLWWLL